MQLSVCEYKMGTGNSWEKNYSPSFRANKIGDQYWPDDEHSGLGMDFHWDTYCSDYGCAFSVISGSGYPKLEIF